MKHIITITAIVLLFTSCGVSKTFMFEDGVYAKYEKPRDRYKEQMDLYDAMWKVKMEAAQLEFDLSSKYYPTNGYVKMGAEYERQPQGEDFNVVPDKLVIGDCVLTKNQGKYDSDVYYLASDGYYDSILNFLKKNYIEIGYGYAYSDFDGGVVTQFIDKDNERIMFSIFRCDLRYGLTRIYITDRLVDYNQRMKVKQEKELANTVRNNTRESIKTATKIIF